jgi:hypothetical protein
MARGRRACLALLLLQVLAAAVAAPQPTCTTTKLHCARGPSAKANAKAKPNKAEGPSTVQVIISHFNEDLSWVPDEVPAEFGVQVFTKGRAEVRLASFRTAQPVPPFHPRPSHHAARPAPAALPHSGARRSLRSRPAPAGA